MSQTIAGLSVGTATRQRALKAASFRSASLIVADLAAFLVACTVALGTHAAVDGFPLGPAISHMAHEGTAWRGWGTLLVLAVLLSSFGARRHYTARTPFYSELGAIVTGVAAALVCDAGLRVAVYGANIEGEAAMRWLLFVPFLVVGRQVARAALNMCGMWKLRTVIVGQGRGYQAVSAALTSEPGLGYDLVGSIGLDAAADWQERHAAEGRAGGLLARYDAEFVVVASGERPEREGKVIAALAREQAPFAVVPILDGLPVIGVVNHYFMAHDVMLMVCGNNLARPLSRLTKVMFDKLVAGLALLLLAPLFLALCVLIRRDGGRAFYSHVRIGADGRRFGCLKFRSMAPNSAEILARLLTDDAAARAEWEQTQKLRDDPRITRLGRVLRETSLDELPQLINVLRGEMSLVGPRPIVDAEVPRYGDNISYYYEARPGITGLWQVSGRSETTYDQRVRLDVWYVRNWSLWHDIAILMKTIPAVVLKHGAV